MQRYSQLKLFKASRHISWKLFLVSFCVFVIGGCNTNEARSETVTLGATIPNVNLLVVTCESGDIEIIQDPSAVIMQVKADIRCVAETSEAAAERARQSNLSTSYRQEDGQVTLKVVFPPRISNISNDFSHIVIRAAKLDGISAQTSNGKLSLEAFRGTANLQNSNGAISVKGHSGSIKMKSSNGAVEAIKVDGPVTAETSNGSITVLLNAAAQGSIDLSTSNAGVSLVLPEMWQGSVKASTSNGQISFDGGSKASDIKVNDDRGSMTFGDPTKSTATLKTSNGNVTVQMVLGKVILSH